MQGTEKDKGSMSQRAIIFEEVIKRLLDLAKNHEEKARETLLKTGEVDGPWQSKQPDMLFNLQRDAAISEGLANGFKKRAEELRTLQAEKKTRPKQVQLGSIIKWEINDPKSDKPIGEIAILTRTGGADFGNYRLLSLDAPVSKAILGKKAGETVRFRGYTITIKEIL